MAITLPTLTVTDAQGDRILAAFQRQYGVTTRAEAVVAYKRWLARTLRTMVLTDEANQIDAANELAKGARITELAASLPDPEAVT